VASCASLAAGFEKGWPSIVVVLIHLQNKEHFSASMTQDIGQAEGRTSNKPEGAGHQCVGSFASSEQEDSSDSSDDEAENFSDIDDVEVDGYLHNEEEKELKKIIWEGMNREYLEAQAAKEAAATAAKEAYKANSLNGSEDLLDAKEFAKATAAALAKSRKSDQDSGKRQKIESDAAGACDLPNNIENHAVDPGATEDGDGSGAFEDGMYAEVSYDDYDGNGDEDFGYYEDFDFSF
ncbi:unnamed protein product, partial [Musa textilis]